jgi:aryl-alcohol dehydrogenase-like predicted oxidoreductase
MRYEFLGESTLRVSEIGLGTMTFGEQNTQKEAFEQLDLAFSRGVNFIDTAEMYPVPTKPETQGRTETFVGEWLKTRARDQVIVATKIAGPGRPIPWVRNGSLAINRASVRAAVDDSLRRLQTDYIDLYQIHWPDRYVPIFGEVEYQPAKERSSTPIEEQLRALADVVRQGKVRFVGLSNESAWGVSAFRRAAEAEGLPRVVSIQNAYSLLNRAFDTALAETSRRERVELLAYSPLAFGVLTGKYVDGPKAPGRLTRFEAFGARYRKANVEQAVAAYAALAREVGVSPTQLALAFVRSRWFVRSTLIGATSLKQLEENLSSVDVRLDEATLAKIDAIQARYPNPAQ